MFRQYSRPVEAEYERPEDYLEALDAYDRELILREQYIADRYPRLKDKPLNS